MRFKVASVISGLCALLAISPITAKAASISIVNAGFEDTGQVLDHLDPVRGDYAFGAIGWTVTASQSGTYDPLTGAGKPYATGVPDGRVGFMNSGILSQTLSATFLAGTDYLLSFDVGHRRDTGFPSATAMIFAGSSATPVKSIALTDPGSGNFLTEYLTLSASDIAPYIGQSIGIKFASQDVQVNIDNVFLSTVPLPSALLLFMSGFGMLGFSMRRKSKAEQGA